ncbi:MAG TPA: serine/threonine-protein kinase, partial [Nannocystaceae bacterium]|nr:serine/threonine-protein kinase [Nannocystaceae bacterium]
MSEIAHDAPTLGERAAIGRIGAALFGGDAELPVLGRYRVIERIGAGAFGAVYLAEDPQLRRRVAIKLAHRSHGDIAWRERQRREWLALAKLAHPNIVGVHTVESTVDARWFIVMELVDGGDLRKWSARSPARAQILDVLAQAGRGLAAAHAAGLVHRDFKPDNVLLDRDGRAKVGDFGLARELAVAEDSADAIATQSGAAGTPAYMAPEQILYGRADAKSDQFAFCVSAFEVLTGARPFRGRTAIELAHAAEVGAIEGASRLPSSVRAVVLRGLAGDPARRHRDMDALLAAWDRRGRAGPAICGAAVVGVALLMAGTPVHAAAAICERDDAIDRAAEDVRTQVSRRITDARADDVSARLESFVAGMHDTRTEACGASIELFDRQSVCLAGAERALATLREWIP